MAKEFSTHLLGASAEPSYRGNGETRVYLSTARGSLKGNIGGQDTRFAGRISQVLAESGKHDEAAFTYDPEGEMNE